MFLCGLFFEGRGRGTRHGDDEIGVHGCVWVWKTTLASRVARYLGCEPLIEGDAYHDVAMKEKMRAGVPLTDEDRWPWLDRVNQAMRERTSEWSVVTCSALRRSYRDRLSRGLNGTIHFIFLDAPRDIISDRLSKRQHEFMSPILLDSQLATLERPLKDEPVSTISVAGSHDEAFEAITGVLSGLGRRGVLVGGA